MIAEFIPADALSLVKEWLLTGSRIVCDPPVVDTDLDIVIRLEDEKACCKFLKICEQHDWYHRTASDSDPEYGRSCMSVLRKGDINLLIVWSKDEFSVWQAYTAAAKILNLKEKENRVDLSVACHNALEAERWIETHLTGDALS